MEPEKPGDKKQKEKQGSSDPVRSMIMKKVAKFGGSSLASAGQMKKVADIIHADETRRFVVPSAPRKALFR